MGDMIVVCIEIVIIVYFMFINDLNYGVYIYNEYIFKYEIYGCFMKLKVDVLIMIIEVSCLWIVILCFDVIIINIVWIVIDVYCGVMVYWWSIENKMYIFV